MILLEFVLGQHIDQDRVVLANQSPDVVDVDLGRHESIVCVSLKPLTSALGRRLYSTSRNYRRTAVRCPVSYTIPTRSAPPGQSSTTQEHLCWCDALITTVCQTVRASATAAFWSVPVPSRLPMKPTPTIYVLLRSDAHALLARAGVTSTVLGTVGPIIRTHTRSLGMIAQASDRLPA